MGLLEGAKMSSSKGNVVLLKSAIDKFGADVVRLFLMSNAEPWQDFDWRENEVVGAQKGLSRFMTFADSVKGMDVGKESNIDRWLISKLQTIEKEMNEALDQFQTRKALQTGFFEVFQLLKWYERRGGNNGTVLREFVSDWTKLLAPFTPYICEEVWSKIGEGFVLEQEFPAADESKINLKAENAEKMLEGLLADIDKIVEITGKKPKIVSVYTAEDWKYELFEKINNGAQIGDVMKDDKFKKHGKDVVNLFKKAKDVSLMSGLTNSDENDILNEAKEFLEKEIGCSVTVNPKEDPQNKARFALPVKPAIYIE